MRTALLILASALLLSAGHYAGQSTPPSSSSPDSAREFFDSIPEALGENGPMAWLPFFEDSPAFFMATDGAVAFAGYEDAAAFLWAFAPTVSEVEMAWDDVRVETLGDNAAVVAASYSERIVVADSTLWFSGYVTGVAQRDSGAWRLQHLHWSSPRPEN